MKRAIACKPPESVWDTIQEMPLIVRKSCKKRKNVGRTLLFSAAACVLVILSALLVKKQLPFWNSDITQAPHGHETSQPLSPDTSSKQVSSLSYPVKGSDIKLPNNDKLKDMLQLWAHRLYQNSGINLTEGELEQQYKKAVNGNLDIVYSIKGKSITESFAWKSYGVIYRFDCVDDGIFTVDGKTYGLTEERPLLAKKGEYLCEENGAKIYEILGDPQKILVDVSSLVSFSRSECFYTAQLLDEKKAGDID